jgi:hypothetical protein
MVESKESYWGKHHWGIIQGLSGVYCAIFATLERYHPRSIPTPQSPTTAHPAPVGAAMTPNYSMPFWLWVGIVVFVLSVVIPVVLRMISAWEMRKKVGEPEPSIQDAAPELFTPLQIEAFRVAIGLRRLIDQTGPRPEIPPYVNRTEEEIANRITFRRTEDLAWLTRLRLGYEEHFSGKIKDLMFRFAREYGGEDSTLRRHVQFIDNQNDILNIANCLIRLAHMQDGIDCTQRYS